MRGRAAVGFVGGAEVVAGAGRVVSPREATDPRVAQPATQSASPIAVSRAPDLIARQAARTQPPPAESSRALARIGLSPKFISPPPPRSPAARVLYRRPLSP